MSHPTTNQQQNTLTPGDSVRTPAGIGTLESYADVLKRGSDTEVESVAALVVVNGHRRVYDVSRIKAVL